MKIQDAEWSFVAADAKGWSQSATIEKPFEVHLGFDGHGENSALATVSIVKVHYDEEGNQLRMETVEVIALDDMVIGE